MKKVKSLVFLVSGFWFLVSAAYAANITTDLENNTYDLGKVEEGQVLTKEFVIINNSAVPVRISLESLGCGCLKIISPKGKVELAPGARQKALFNFDSVGFSGEVAKPLYIYTTDETQPIVKVDIYASVAAHQEAFVKRFLSFSSLTILGAGLIDGINPCAFTVMVFFVSFLSFAGYKKSDTIVIGILFILAVYITYTLIGLGAFKALRTMEVFNYFSRLFYKLIAGFAFIVGLFNLYDYWIYRKTKDPERITIKLPFIVKRKIQQIVRGDFIKQGEDGKKLLSLVFASLSCGFLVSVLELLCTGQLYLPTLVYIFKIPDLRMKAFFYLIVYNLMFVLPLIGVFVLAFFGFTSARFERIARGHLATVKLLTAFVFIGLAVFLLMFKGG